MIPARLRLLRRGMEKRGLDSLLITDPRSVFYYGGFFANDDPAYLVVHKNGKPVLIVSPLSNEAKNVHPRVVFGGLDEVKKELSGTVGIDEVHFSVKSLFHLDLKNYHEAHESITAPRMVKDAAELRLIRKAVRITKTLFQQISLTGKREHDVALSIQHRLLDLGIHPSFPPIVSSGKNTELIHYTPGERKITKNDFVIVDMGCVVDHYCSDLTRTFAPRDSSSRRVVETIANIQDELRDRAVPGIRFSDIQKAYAHLMKKNRFPLVHSFGHGVGLAVHERPQGTDILQKGMVITIEPGVYQNKKGCRIEDMFVISTKAKKL